METRIPFELKKNGRQVRIFVDERMIEISKNPNPQERITAVQNYVASLSEEYLRNKGAIRN